MRHAPVVIAWREVGTTSPLDPLRFVEAPGLALLRQNLAWLRVEQNPPPTHLERIARAKPLQTAALFGACRLAPALRGCQHLAALGCRPVAVRGRHVPAEARADFSAISFDGRLLPVLAETGLPLPERWTAPVVLLETHHPRLRAVRLGALFSRAPAPGALNVQDLLRADQGNITGSASAVGRKEAQALLDAFQATGVRAAMVIDLGADAAALAELAAGRNMLGGWLGRASSPLPQAVLDTGCPVWTWFDPADTSSTALQFRPQVATGVAWAPIGLADEPIPEATARLLQVRELGYRAVVPRFYVPCPNTQPWQAYESRFGLRPIQLDKLGSRHLVFQLPGWEPVEGPEVLEALSKQNQWPAPTPNHAVHRRSVSFEAMRQMLDEYLSDAVSRVPDCHARDLLASVLTAVQPGPERLQEIDEYPFVAINGHNLMDLVQQAVQTRLLSLGDIPAELSATIRHASLVGGKRIRPILTLVMTSARGVSLDAAMPAALATEWLHTASLIQDDLPCMDDDDIRRRDIATHRRHGEGMALLASDALIAMAVDDIAKLAAHPAVGSQRAIALVAAITRALGSHGLVGGQVRDLITRRLNDVTLQEVLEVHRRKTVPLFQLTAELAAILGDIEEPLASELTALLASVGLAFQIIDDVLDATAGNDAFGRPAGSDQRNTLPTFATLMDTNAGRRYANKLIQPHLASLNGHPGLFGLQRLSSYVLERRQ